MRKSFSMSKTFASDHEMTFPMQYLKKKGDKHLMS